MRAKLTKEQRAAIVDARKAGIANITLAKRYGVTEAAISLIYSRAIKRQPVDRAKRVAGPEPVAVQRFADDLGIRRVTRRIAIHTTVSSSGEEYATISLPHVSLIDGPREDAE